MVRSLTVFLVLPIFFILFSISFAQDEGKDIRTGGYARVQALGNNPYIVDPDNIKLNPAYSSVYYNFIWGDIGSSNGNEEDGYGQFAGFNYRFNKTFTLGFMLTRNDFTPSYCIGSLDTRGLVSQINDVGTGANIVSLDNNFEILGTYNLGDYVLGLALAYAATHNDYTPATGTGDKNSASQFGINFGIMGTVSADFRFDAGVSLILPSATYEPGTAGVDKLEASNTDLLLNARGYFRLSNKISLVPNIAFYNSTGTFKVGAQSADLASLMGLLVGVGLHYQVGDLLIAGGPSFMYQSETIPSVANISPELSNSSVTFPGWNMGIEWYLTDWLIGRLGYVASTFSEVVQETATATTVNERDFTDFSRGDVRIGLGFRLGGFTLDATVNDQVLREGLNLVGGGTPTFAYLSASYAF